MAGKSTFGSVDRLPSGRYRARYTGPDGRMYSARTAANRPFTFDTKGHADAFLARTRTAISEGTWAPPDRPVDAPVTVRAYAERWLARRTLRATTREHYGELLTNHILPTFGDLAVVALSPVMVADWHARDAKPTAKAHAYALLRTICTSAVDEDVIAKNPCRVRGGGSTPPVKSMEKAPTPAQIDALVAAIPGKYKCMVLLAVWCSLRFGEIVAIERTDLDLDAGIIWVRRGVTSTKAEGLKAGDPKTKAGRRLVTIPAHVVPALRAHLEEHAGPVLVFPAAGGGYMAGSALWKVYTPALTAAGLDGLTFHNLRGVGQTYAAAAGANLRELMNRAGQVSPQAALRYLGEVDGRQREIADRLAAFATASNVTPITTKAKSPRKRNRSAG